MENMRIIFMQQKIKHR